MMGDVLIKSSLLLGSILSLAIVFHGLGWLKIQVKHLLWGGRTLAALLTISLLFLLYLFYLPDFNVNYVFSKVALETPLIYRLSAVWVGQEGVFLVWAWAISVCLLYYSEKRGLNQAFDRRVFLLLILLCTFFVGLGYLMHPFDPTLDAVRKSAAASDFTLENALNGLEGNGYYTPEKGFIQGRGMSPVLMSPWMALHPPVVFIAYALSAVPFAVCLIYLFERKGDWESRSRQWARLSWLFLSAGLVIGSFWAYEELSFGGYWTWDPIETASLIPWITLTIFLHGSSEYRRIGTFGLIAPAFGVLTTVLIIYGTFITKSGLITSSHAYSRTIITPFLLAAILLSLVILFAAVLRLYLLEKRPKMEWLPLVSTKNAFYLSLLLFTLLLLVLLWGITYPLFAKFIQDKTVVFGKVFYNNKGYPFTAAIVLMSGFCLLLWVLKKGSVLSASIGVVVISIAGYLVKPSGSVFIDTFLPIGIFASLGAVLRMKKEITRKAKKTDVVKGVSAHILHLGIAVLLIGVVISGSQQTGKDLIYTYPSGINTEKDAGEGYTVKLLTLFVFQNSQGNWVQQANVTVYKNGGEAGKLSLIFVNDRQFGRHPKVSILRGFSSDLYAVYYGISGGHEQGESILPINVKVNPYVSLVWIGSILSILSLAAIVAIDTLYSKS